MGANLSLGKATNDVPSHGKEVTLAFLQQHWQQLVVFVPHYLVQK